MLVQADHLKSQNYYLVLIACTKIQMYEKFDILTKFILFMAKFQLFIVNELYIILFLESILVIFLLYLTSDLLDISYFYQLLS